ncbi:hypothetical protein CCR85_12800 [Rhodothalassium salexigens]|nr:hypothetical protein [Rhodothalassium salexigens]MBK5921495.1 hypothetical protein [Rhodothalassium salexigens]
MGRHRRARVRRRPGVAAMTAPVRPPASGPGNQPGRPPGPLALPPEFLALARGIDWVNAGIGWLLGGAALVLVVLQFALVLASHTFSLGSIAAQDARFYVNGAMVLGAAGYTLLMNEHVRVDLFYRGAPAQHRALIDLAGILALLGPVLFLLWWSATPYVLESWAQREGAIESGALDYVYWLKGMLLAFAATLSLQAVSGAIKAWAELFGTLGPAGDAPSAGRG